MGSRRHAGAAALIAALALLPATVSVQEGRTTGPSKDWPLVGGDSTNARYSALDQINTQTVSRLSGAWMRRFDSNASSRATPVVQDGRLFIAAGAQIYALNAKTGDTIWTTRLDQRDAPDITSVFGIRDAWAQQGAFPAAQGMAVGEGLLFVGLTNGYVAALRQSDGGQAWIQLVGNDPAQYRGQAVSGAPAYAGGMVFAGLASGDWGTPCRITALDAKTGKELWRVKTIPGPGEPGHETWPKNSDVYTQGGGGVWHVGAVDLDLGLVFFGTGNAGPILGGEIREGDNLYTNSVLAIDIKTGRIRWYYQLVHHDVWDVDVAVPVILYEAQVNGRPQKAVAVLRPDGYFFLFDRATGTPLFPIEERKVPQDAFLKTSPTQPFVVGAGRVVPECDTWKSKVKAPFVLECPGFAPPYRDKHNVLTPGFGVNRVLPMAYSPQTGYFYAQGNASLSRARRISDDPWVWASGAQSLATPRSVGVLTAIDHRTNTVAWTIESPIGGALLATAGGLVFRTAADGNMEAFDARTGKRLWQFQTGRLGRGIPASYEVDGDQYIAVPSGQLMWAFKLGGTVKPEPAPTVPAGTIPIQDVNEIETGTLFQSQSGNFGRRWVVDEHGFSPLRAGLKAGARMRFMNNGKLVHTVVADDGSWSTGPLRAAQSVTVPFDKPGTYRYQCKDHPWAIGEIIVKP